MKGKVKKIIAFFTVAMLIFSVFIGCTKQGGDNVDNSSENKKTEELQTVRLNEVVRSVFYAPMYIAINEGFFEEEGLSIDLSTGQGADKTMQQLLSGNVDIGFSGP